MKVHMQQNTKSNGTMCVRYSWVATSQSNKYILTFQECFSKYFEAIPITDQSADTVVKEFATKIVCRHGTPDQSTKF